MSKGGKEKTMPVRCAKWTKFAVLLILPLFSASGCAGDLAAPTPGDVVSVPPVGVAAGHPDDQGISGDPEVIFADNFELWDSRGALPPPGTWDVRRNRTSQTRVVPGNVTINGSAGPGEKVLEISCWTEDGGSQVGGLTLKLGNYDSKDEGLGDGYDELFVRYYMKFDEEYRVVRNHGSNLGGRDLQQKNPAWVGMAGIRDVSSRGYFYSGVQPYGLPGDNELMMGFYSYHLDKRDQWGDQSYPLAKRVYIRVGTWHCVERHMKLNSVDPTKADPANADGLEELWIDGVLTVRKAGVRFRRVPQLHITFFSLETYYHKLPFEYDRSHPIKVYFDNVVISRRYVGPLKK